ncbi:hypothetical protein QP157_15345 [Sphingomonas sp. LR61]
MTTMYRRTLTVNPVSASTSWGRTGRSRSAMRSTPPCVEGHEDDQREDDDQADAEAEDAADQVRHRADDGAGAQPRQQSLHLLLPDAERRQPLPELVLHRVHLVGVLREQRGELGHRDHERQREPHQQDQDHHDDDRRGEAPGEAESFEEHPGRLDADGDDEGERRGSDDAGEPGAADGDDDRCGETEHDAQPATRPDSGYRRGVGTDVGPGVARRRRIGGSARSVRSALPE